MGQKYIYINPLNGRDSLQNSIYMKPYYCQTYFSIYIFLHIDRKNWQGIYI